LRIRAAGIKNKSAEFLKKAVALVDEQEQQELRIRAACRN
jgi:hypothetical protein